MRLTAKLLVLMLCGQRAAVGCGSFSGMFAKDRRPAKMAVGDCIGAPKMPCRVATMPRRSNSTKHWNRASTACSRNRQFSILLYAQYKLGERSGHRCGGSFHQALPKSRERRLRLLRQGPGQFHRRSGPAVDLRFADLSERDQKSAREAYVTFKTLVEKFPQSRYNADSLLRMRYLVNALSQNESHCPLLLQPRRLSGCH